MKDASPAWKSSPDHPHYVAAKNATKLVYGVEPDLTREGGSIPVALTFQVNDFKFNALMYYFIVFINFYFSIISGDYR